MPAPNDEVICNGGKYSLVGASCKTKQANIKNTENLEHGEPTPKKLFPLRKGNM